MFPQENLRPGIEDAATFYEREYGSIGLLYYNLGLNELYSSWWYIALIVALAVSIVVASFDRGIPLYKALKAQRVTRHPHFMTRQRLFAATKAAESTSVDLKKSDFTVKEKALYHSRRKRKSISRKESVCSLGSLRQSRWLNFVFSRLLNALFTWHVCGYNDVDS